MSSTAIDTSRTTERLSAFLSEIGAAKPIDQYFTKNQTLDYMYKNKKMQDGGRQIMYPIGTGENPNATWASDFDVIATSGSDNARMVVYPFVNIFSSINISWEEMREIAGSDHKIFDRMSFKRDEMMATARKMINSALFAAAQDASKITSLAVAIDSTGTTGGLSAATEAQWAAQETAVGDTFANKGYNAMLTMYNDLDDVGSEPSCIVTTQDIFEAYEQELNPDVRYGFKSGDKGVRGFSDLLFKKTPIIFDGSCTSQAMYFINDEWMPFIVDTDGDFSFDEFQVPVNQKVFTAKFTFRGNIICNQRRAHGKLTGIS